MKKNPILRALIVALACLGIFAGFSAVSPATAAPATAPAAVTGTSSYYIQNSPYSNRSYPLAVDNYCYAAKLGSTWTSLFPNGITWSNNDGFRVPTGRYFSVWKNGVKYINNARSQGNAICVGNWNAFVLIV